MTRTPARLVGVLLGLVAVARLAAQQPPQLARGQRVRVVQRVAYGRLSVIVSGTLDHLQGDTVVIEPNGAGALETIALNQGRWLEVPVGKGPTQGRAGALAGLVVGGLAGAVIAADAWRLEIGGLNRIEQTLLGAALGAGAGALIGASVGHFIRSTEWGFARTAGLRITFAPRGAALGAALAF